MGVRLIKYSRWTVLRGVYIRTHVAREPKLFDAFYQDTSINQNSLPVYQCHFIYRSFDNRPLNFLHY